MAETKRASTRRATATPTPAQNGTQITPPAKDNDTAGNETNSPATQTCTASESHTNSANVTFKTLAANSTDSGTQSAVANGNSAQKNGEAAVQTAKTNIAPLSELKKYISVYRDRDAPLKNVQNLRPISNIFRAYKNLKEVVTHTPLTLCMELSEKYKCNVFLKREDLQIVRSFKLRGAYHKITQITEEDRKKGLVCASAGNHAQGFAYSCNKLKAQGTVFMPVNAPQIKVKSVEMWGGEYIKIVRFGNTFDECFRKAKEYNDTHGTVYIHPYDDEKIVEGQASCAVEVLEDWKENQYGKIDFAFMPIGGGGMAAGISSYFAQMTPETALIGVEPLGSPSMQLALQTKKVEPLKSVNPFVDGAAVGIPGQVTYKVLNEVLHEIVLVPEGHCCIALLELYEKEGICSEPAGALAVAALDFYADEIVGKNVVCFISGSNNDLTRMTDIYTMAQVYLGQRYYLLINFSLKRGSMKEFLTQIISEQDEIVQIEYTKGSMKLGPALVGINCPSAHNFALIQQRLKNAQIQYRVLSPDDEIYKLML